VLAEPVTFALDVDGDGAMEEAVEDGGGHDLVGEDVAPGAPGFVGCDDHGFFTVVALGDDLEEEGGLGSFEGGVADFVEDEEPGAEHGGEETVEAIGALCSAEAGDEVVAGDEEDPVAGLEGLDPEADGEGGLADAGRAEEEDVGALATGSVSISRAPTRRASRSTPTTARTPRMAPPASWQGP